MHDDSDPDAYQRKVQKIRESYEERKAAATGEKGLVAVFTGNGKGKSTAAFGMALRALQHGMKVAVVQYVKGAIATAETDAFARFGQQLEWHRMGGVSLDHAGRRARPPRGRERLGAVDRADGPRGHRRVDAAGSEACRRWPAARGSASVRDDRVHRRRDGARARRGRRPSALSRRNQRCDCQRAQLVRKSRRRQQSRPIECRRTDCRILGADAGRAGDREFGS